MQFKVPQNVQIEDKILPFMTLRQLIICGVGGGFTYLVYLMLERQPLSIWSPPVGILALITVSIAFLKVRGIPFVSFVLLLLERYLNEPKRVWVKSAGDIFPKLSAAKSKTKKEDPKKKTLPENSAKDIKKLSRMLDEGLET